MTGSAISTAPETGAISAPAQSMSVQTATIPVLISLCFCHLLNDLIQSLIPALYPLLKQEFSLDFTQIGIITLAFAANWQTLKRHRELDALDQHPT